MPNQFIIFFRAEIQEIGSRSKVTGLIVSLTRSSAVAKRSRKLRAVENFAVTQKSLMVARSAPPCQISRARPIPSCGVVNRVAGGRWPASRKL